MKPIFLPLLALLATAATTGCVVYEVPPPAAPRPVEANVQDVQADLPDHGAIELGTFNDELSPYGEWIERPGYGRVWVPAGVAAGWRPYTLGHWVDSDYGWTWISDEPFGWATYHYGRWSFDDEYGWVWVPGRDWGPAWVAWQSGDGYIGWAPLPPAVGFRAGVGLELGGLDLRVALVPRAYTFVEERVFLAPRIYTHCLPAARNVTLLRQTTNITNYTVIDNRIVNRSVDVHRIEQVTHQKVVTYQLTEGRANERHKGARVEGNRIALYRPTVQGPGAAATQAPTGARPAVQPPVGRRAQEAVIEAPKSSTASRPSQPLAAVPANAPQPRRIATPQELDRRHAAEEKDLEQHQKAERKQLETLHQNDLHQPQARQEGTEVKRRHQEEAHALEEQHQRDRQQLEARHQREKEAATAARKDQEKKTEVKKDDHKQERPKDKERERPPAR
ncbi:MAG TPA: DUF6600 domain-containing protein [Thermoanaerobaculia bacterium]|nr:DUF6600 domain-containing protein [Thermoanaerobaculia bacterium]